MASLRDLAARLAVRESIRPAVHAATITGQTVDTRGFNSASCIIAVGAIVGAGVIVAKLQDSPDGSAWTDVAAADLQGSFPAALLTNTAIQVGYLGDARYLRAVGTLASGTSVAFSAAIVLGDADQRPAV